jgi:hypothetical protein
MSDLAIGGRHETAFRPLTVGLILAIGVMGFIGSLVIGAYGPDLGMRGNGGGHAASDSAIGLSGIVRLARATGRDVRLVRDKHRWDGNALLIATPPNGAIDVGALSSGRPHKPTLLILPKWNIKTDPANQGWVQIQGLIDVFQPQGVLAPQFKLGIARLASGGRPLRSNAYLPHDIQFDAPQPMQVITSATLDAQVRDGTTVDSSFTPLISDGQGHTVLAQIGPGPLYVLADPDLIDNAGLKSLNHARAAVALLDWLSSSSADRNAIDFDVTLNGLGYARNPLTLAFDPPFLAMTLAIAAVLLLLALYALARFGAPRRRERAIAFGKAALVANSAALIRKAGRAHRLGGRYAAVIRDRSVSAFGVSPRLKGEAIDSYLDGLGRGAFTDLAASAEAADDNQSLLESTQALYDWQREKLA